LACQRGSNCCWQDAAGRWFKGEWTLRWWAGGLCRQCADPSGCAPMCPGGTKCC
jgi:hypothetical protein